MNLPLSRYRFAVICFEHNDFQDYKNERIKILSREILTIYGYQLVVQEVGEDFWIDPLQVPWNIWQPFLGKVMRGSAYNQIMHSK